VRAKEKSEGKYKGRATTARAKTELFLKWFECRPKTLEAVAEERKIHRTKACSVSEDHRVSEKALLAGA